MTEVRGWGMDNWLVAYLASGALAYWAIVICILRLTVTGSPLN